MAYSMRWGFMIHGKEYGRWMYIPTPWDDIIPVPQIKVPADSQVIELTDEQRKSIEEAPPRSTKREPDSETCEKSGEAKSTQGTSLCFPNRLRRKKNSMKRTEQRKIS